MTRQAVAILRKDLLLERRSKANLNALIFLAGLILLIVSLALGPSTRLLHSAAGGVLWIAFAFAGVLAFARAYQSESENRCYEALVLAGADPKAIYLGKLAATVIVMLTVETVVIVAMALIYPVSAASFFPWLPIVAALGTVGLAAIGVLYGRLTMRLRAREVMLPLLVLPVVVPVVLAAVQASSLLLSGSTAGIWTWIELLLVFDAVFVTGGLLTFEAVGRE
ncbi:MAG TPA: heme exporter protein CcmB [Chloroflexota bacterium]|jgi:heme exporter protein B|nr:heme exporter protein CcmB [Chloroflexota bacterium]